MIVICVVPLLLLVSRGITGSTSVSTASYTGVKFVALGDSITYGYTPKTDNVQMDEPWPTIVGKTMGFSKVVNMGISGSTLAHHWYAMSERLNDIPVDADIIAIWGGTNDFSHDIPLGTISDNDNTTVYGALNVICAYLNQNFSDSFVFLMTPYPRRGGTGQNNEGYNLLQVRDAVSAVGVKYGIPVLNMYDLGHFQREFNSDVSDGLHPTQDFVRKYTAPQISDFIKRNYHQ